MKSGGGGENNEENGGSRGNLGGWRKYGIRKREKKMAGVMWRESLTRQWQSCMRKLNIINGGNGGWKKYQPAISGNHAWRNGGGGNGLSASYHGWRMAKYRCSEIQPGQLAKTILA
jgi:hypothetical protein